MNEKKPILNKTYTNKYSEAWVDNIMDELFKKANEEFDGDVKRVAELLLNVGINSIALSLAFGADFVLEIHETKRYDRLTDL